MGKIFNEKRKEKPLPGTTSVFSLDSDQNYVLAFRHIPTRNDIFFRAFLTKFYESYTCTWNQEFGVYRMDPIPMYQNTNRKISLGFKVISGGHDEVRMNLSRVQKLQSFLYPQWSGGRRERQVSLAATVKSAPIIGIQFSNLIARNRAEGSRTFLHGYITNLNVDFIHEAGFVMTGMDPSTEHLITPDPTTTGKIRPDEFGIPTERFEEDLFAGEAFVAVGERPMAPQEIDISFDFTVLHRDEYRGYQIAEQGPPGSARDPLYTNRRWPYGVVTVPSEDVIVVPGRGVSTTRNTPSGKSSKSEQRSDESDNLNQDEDGNSEIFNP